MFELGAGSIPGFGTSNTKAFLDIPFCKLKMNEKLRKQYVSS
jgi:hypothetical protein